METIHELDHNQEDLLVTTTGEPTDQLEPEENDDDLTDDNLETDGAQFDDEPMDDDEDLDDDEVKRLFPGEDNFTADEDGDEPYEGIRHGDKEDEGLVDDNMSGMPVVPSPS